MIKSKLRSRNNGVAKTDDDDGGSGNNVKFSNNKSTISNFFPTKPCEIVQQTTEINTTDTTRKRKLRSSNNNKILSTENQESNIKICDKPNGKINNNLTKKLAVPISKFFQQKEDDCNIVADFETPKKSKRIIQTNKTKEIVSKQRKTRKKSSIINKKSNQLINEHFFTDSTTDQVDLVNNLATNSTQTIENQKNPTKKQNNSIKKNITTILENFEFKSNDKISKNKNLNNINSFLVQKHSGRHKWNIRNTALTRRNPEIQLKKLNLAIEQILLVNSPLSASNSNEEANVDDDSFTYFLESNLLRKCHIPENILFTLNSTANIAKLNQFYTNNLFEISKTKCGVLLKDWSIIPGRPISPTGGFFEQLSNSTSVTASPPPPPPPPQSINNLEKSTIEENDDEINEKLREFDELEPVKVTKTTGEAIINQPSVVTELPGKNNEISSMIITNYALKSYRNNRPRSPDMFNDDDNDDNDDNYNITDNKSDEQLSPPPSSVYKLSISGGCITPSVSPTPSRISNADFDKVSDSTYNSLSSQPSTSKHSSPVHTISLESSNSYAKKTDEDLLIELYQTGKIFTANLDTIQTNIMHHIDENDKTHEIHLTESQSGVISYEQFSDCGVNDNEEVSPTSPPPNFDRDDFFNSSKPHYSFFNQNANATPTTLNVIHQIDENDTTHEIHLSVSQSGTIFNEQFSVSGGNNKDEVKPTSPPPNFDRDDAFNSSIRDNSIFHQNVNVTPTTPNLMHKIDENNTTHEINLTESQSDAISNEQFSDTDGNNKDEVSHTTPRPNFDIDDSFQSPKPDNSFLHQNIDENDTTHEIDLTENQSGVISYDKFTDSGASNKEEVPPLSPLPNYDKYDSFQSSKPDNSFFHQNPHTTTDAIEFSFDNIDNNDEDRVNITKTTKNMDSSLIIIESSDEDIDFNDKKSTTTNLQSSFNITQQINEIYDYNFDDNLHLVNNIDENSSSSSTGDINEMLNESIQKLVENNDESFKLSPLVNERQQQQQQQQSSTAELGSPDNSLDFEIKHMNKTYQVKTGKNISPKPNYEEMSSPERSIHLNRYGLKQLPTKLAVICLNHIYNQMHPYVECKNDKNQLLFS